MKTVTKAICFGIVLVASQNTYSWSSAESAAQAAAQAVHNYFNRQRVNPPPPQYNPPPVQFQYRPQPALNFGGQEYEIYDQYGRFRGNLNQNQLDPNSIYNRLGRYGSPISSDSPLNLMNRYEQYEIRKRW